MTREETKTIVRATMICYANWHPEDVSLLVDLWAAMLKDYPYQAISAALQSYIMQGNAFAPTPGQLVQLLPSKDDLSGLDAWQMVRKALQNGIYGAEAEYAKLPEIVQRAVGSPEQIRAWATAPEETVETVMQSNFLRTFEATKARQRNEKYMPEGIADLLAAKNDDLRLAEKNPSAGENCLPEI